MRASRILMFCEQFYPRIGGAERQAGKLACALIDRGCSVEVLTPQHDPSWPRTERIDGVLVHRFPYIDLCSRLPGLRGLGVPNTLLGWWQVRRAVGKLIENFDVVHGHIASPMVVYAMNVGHTFGKKGICKIALSGARWDLESLMRTSMLGPQLARHALAKMDMWVAISEEVRQQLQECGVEASRIRSIPNGVVVAKGLLQLPKSLARRYLYLGRLSGTGNRDFETLLRAFDRLAQEIPDCELCLVGGGEREGKVRKLLASFPDARTRTHLVGFTDPARWLDWADVLVQPSLREGMSNAILEAMAVGVCCIANDIPANREVLDAGRAGVLVPVGSVDSLTAAMRDMAVISGEALRWGQLGRQRALAVYSMEKVVDDYLSLYADLTGSKS